MSLRTRVVSLLLVIGICFIGLNYLSEQLILLPSFKSLEQSEAQKDIERVEDAIQREIHYLDVFCHNWAAWDDTYEYIMDYNMDFVVSNLNEETFYDQNLNLVLFVTTKGHVLWSHLVDLERKKEIRVKEVPLDYIPPDHPFLALTSFPKTAYTSFIKGILMTSHGPMMIAMRPIVTSANKGPVRGTLVMGRFLNDSLIKILQEQTRVDFQLWKIPGGRLLPPEAKQYVEQLDKKKMMIRERDRNILEIYTFLEDYHGATALLLRANIMRNITIKGISTMKFYSYSIAGIGTLMTLILLIMLQNAVVGPISKLTEHTIAIGKSEGVFIASSLNREDEIGILAQEFDRLVLTLRNLSVRDELTGLYNRRGFMSMVEHELKLANRNGHKMSFLFIDLDDFKQINDTLGHKVGDLALIDAANLLKETFRETDIIARMGGDEFTVCFTTGDDVVVHCIENLKKNLEALNAVQKHYRLSFSMGTAKYTPDDPCSIDELLSRADKQMYQQKRNRKKRNDYSSNPISRDTGNPQPL